MADEGTKQGISNEDTGRGRYRLLLTLGVVFLLFGLMSTAGSLMSKHLSGDRLEDPFNILFTPILLYLIPSILIAYALARLKSTFRVTTVGVIAITCFGLAVSLMGEIMKTHNYFVRSDENITQAFNNVEIIYQKRFNLIRNMDISSKGYEAHEQSVIKDIADARKAAMSVANEDEKLSALGKFDSSIRSLVINIEQYPNLKADKIVLELMKEMTTTERELVAQKTDFNRQVTDYNRSIRLMPYTITARMFNFQPRKFIDKESTTEIYDARKLLQPSK